MHWDFFITQAFLGQDSGTQRDRGRNNTDLYLRAALKVGDESMFPGGPRRHAFLTVPHRFSLVSILWFTPGGASFQKEKSHSTGEEQ